MSIFPDAVSINNSYIVYITYIINKNNNSILINEDMNNVFMESSELQRATLRLEMILLPRVNCNLITKPFIPDIIIGENN